MHRFLLLIFLLPCAQLSAQIDFSPRNPSTHELLKNLDIAVTDAKYERVTSILIAKDSKLVFERYYNGANENSKHNTRSAMKTIATFLTGIAIEKGHIQSEKDKIFQYLGQHKPVRNPDPRKENITIEDLLTMSNMLECDDNNMWSRGNEERMYPIEDWTQFFLDLPIRSYPWGPKPEDAPYGRVFAYCTAGAAAVAAVVESAVGMRVAEFHKQNFLQPLGITDYVLHYSPKGILNTAGGSEYRSRDLLKMIQMCMNEGKWKGKQIVPKKWLQKATTPKVNAREGTDYGYLFWLTSFGGANKYPSYYMSGNGGNRMHAFPDLGLTVVVTTTNYGNRRAHSYVDEMLNQYIVPAFAK